MVCTYCSGKTQVVNSRLQRKSNQVWRRRQCLSCRAIFSSQEAVRYELAWVVQGGRALRPFSRDKLLLSLHKCCEHRPDALSDAQGLTETVINKLPVVNAAKDSGGHLSQQDIARAALVALNRFDKTAAVRYLSLHRLAN